MNLSAAVSFSGGKDSVLALYYALKQGYNVKFLANFVSQKYKRSSFHGIKEELIDMQAECLGVKLLQYHVGLKNSSYEKKFCMMLKKLKNLGMEYFICGDIYLEEHPNWIKKQCDKFGLNLYEPLWKKPTLDIVKEFINLGFRAKVVSVDAKVLPKELVGKDLDENFVKEIQGYKCCICGENGEYHTFVYDGPIFKRRIQILKTEIVFKKTFWEAWFLDIKEVKVEKK
jgi:diphthine-ammonia ligase